MEPIGTMAQAGKIYNAIQEIKMMKIEIKGISKVRWPGSEDIDYPIQAQQKEDFNVDLGL